MKSHAIYLTQTPGRCRWCRCTHYEPCANGCGWANREQTLCTECVPLDRAMRNVPGRRELAEFLQESDFARDRVARLRTLVTTRRKRQLAGARR
jgi:hypothetical protein